MPVTFHGQPCHKVACDLIVSLGQICLLWGQVIITFVISTNINFSNLLSSSFPLEYRINVQSCGHVPEPYFQLTLQTGLLPAGPRPGTLLLWVPGVPEGLCRLLGSRTRRPSSSACNSSLRSCRSCVGRARYLLQRLQPLSLGRPNPRSAPSVVSIHYRLDIQAGVDSGLPACNSKSALKTNYLKVLAELRKLFLHILMLISLDI